MNLSFINKVKSKKQDMKRIILSLLLTVIAVAGWGQEEFTIGKINYVVTGDNTCSVKDFMPGSNEEIDFVVPSSVSNNNVEYTVEGINKLACLEAIKSNGFVKSVTLPNTLRYIKEGAFAGSLIASIVIPEGVTTLGEYAFAHCPNLTSVTLPYTLTTIEKCENANFYGPNSTSLSEGNFINNSNLPSSVIAEQLGIKSNNEEPNIEINNVTIDKIIYVLYDNNTGAVIGAESGIAGDIVIPSSVRYNNKDYAVTTIRGCAFEGTNISSIVVSEGITTIYSYALQSCPNLESITLPSTLMRVTDDPLVDYDYTSITLSYIRKDKFINNAQFDFESTWELIGFKLYDEKTSDGIMINNHVVVGYNGANEPGLSITIPEGVTKIEPIVTWTNLETIVMPESITEISNSAFRFCPMLKNITIKGQNVNIGDYAFDECYNIKNITLYAMTPPVANNLGMLGQVYNNATLQIPFVSLKDYKKSSAWARFRNCVGIETPGVHLVSEDKIKYALFDNDNTSWVISTEFGIAGDIVIPSDVRYDNKNYAITTIKERAFWSTDITSVVVPEGVTTIETYAFLNCPNLQSIKLPASFNNIAFDSETAAYVLPITSCIHKDNIYNLSQIKDEFDIWKLGISLYDEKTADGLIIGNHVLVGYVGSNEPGLSITIPEGVTAISPIFTWSYLETIILPESVTEISSSTFSTCISLKNVTIKGENVNIPTSAFSSCYGIKNFTMYDITPPVIDTYNTFSSSLFYNNATLYVPYTSVNAYKTANGWTTFKNIVGFVPEGYYLHHYFNCKDEELTSDEYAYLTKDDSEKRYVNGDGHEYGSNGMCKHCGEPLKCAKPTYDAENGLRCKTEGVEYEIKSGYWIATSPEMPTDISLTIIAKKDGYIDSDPLLLSISKLDLNNDGKFDLNDLKYLQDKVLEK